MVFFHLSILCIPSDEQIGLWLNIFPKLGYVYLSTETGDRDAIFLNDYILKGGSQVLEKDSPGI